MSPVPQFSSSPCPSPTPMTRPVAAFLLLFVLLLFAASFVEAQSPPPSNESSNSNDNSFKRGDFNKTMAIIILVAASTFFFLFYIIFICQSGRSMNDLAAAAEYAIDNQRRQRGLDPSVLETFPILVYSEVKEHKIGKGALECAICLIEFEDDDTIHLLPQCDHVFHQSCIDAWLASHVTCPVCRTNYAAYTPDSPAPAVAAAQDEEATPGVAADHIVEISVNVEERKVEMMELARIASRIRGSGSKWPRRLPRSHSTGHSVVMRQGEGTERYTLRLPENLRKEIIAAGKLQRATTFGATEGGSRGGIGEGNRHQRRSLNLGRFERWPSFFRRSMSAARVSVWAGSLRQLGEEGPVKEGSSTVKGGLVMEASLKEEYIRGKLASARSSLDF